MTQLEQLHALARYNRWMNERLYGHAATLDDTARRHNRGAFFKSIHGTFNHLLLADRIWLARLTGDAARFLSRDARGDVIPVIALSQELYADFDELRRERAQTDADLLAFVASLDETALAREFSYASMKGAPQSHVLWWAVIHLFNHQTHHRGQVTTLLMQAGVDPGVTDLLAMLREEAAG